MLVASTSTDCEIKYNTQSYQEVSIMNWSGNTPTIDFAFNLVHDSTQLLVADSTRNV